MPYTLELDYDQLDKLTLASLEETKASFEGSYNLIKNSKGEQGPCIFATGAKEDRKQIKKHIKACELLIEYMGGNL